MTAGKVPSLRTTADLVIVGTSYVTPRHEEPFYAVVAYPHGDTDGQPAAFMSRDADLWNRAVDLEGSAGPVAVTWYPARRKNGQDVKVATAIEPQPLAVAS